MSGGSLHCRLCGSSFPCLASHVEAVHSGPAALLHWACGRCAFRAADLQLLLSHALAVGHPVRRLRPLIQEEALGRLLGCLAEVLGEGTGDPVFGVKEGRSVKTQEIFPSKMIEQFDPCLRDPRAIPKSIMSSKDASFPSKFFLDKTIALGSQMMVERALMAERMAPAFDESALSEESFAAAESPAKANPRPTDQLDTFRETEAVVEDQSMRAQTPSSPPPKASRADSSRDDDDASPSSAVVTASSPPPSLEAERCRLPPRKRGTKKDAGLFSPRRKLTVPQANVDAAADSVDKRLSSMDALEAWLADVANYLSVRYAKVEPLGTEDARWRCSGVSEGDGECPSAAEAWAEAGGEVSAHITLHHSHPLADFRWEVRTLFSSLTTCSGQPRQKPRAKMPEFSDEPFPGRAQLERLDRLRHSDPEAFLAAALQGPRLSLVRAAKEESCVAGSPMAYQLGQLTNAENGRDYELECFVDARGSEELKPIEELLVQNTFQRFNACSGKPTGEKPGEPLLSLLEYKTCHLSSRNQRAKNATKKTGCKALFRVQFFLYSREEARDMRLLQPKVSRTIVKASEAPYQCHLRLSSKHNHPLDSAEVASPSFRPDQCRRVRACR